MKMVVQNLDRKAAYFRVRLQRRANIIRTNQATDGRKYCLKPLRVPTFSPKFVELWSLVTHKQLRYCRGL